jgi:hypothetical protein
MNTLIVTSSLLYIAYIVIGLIVNYPQWKANGKSFTPPQPVVTPQPSPQPVVTPQPSQALEPSSPIVTLTIPSAPPQPSPQPLPNTVKALRKLATDRGIVWKNVHGKNLHLNKEELLQALS